MARPQRLSSIEYGARLGGGNGDSALLGVHHLLLARLELPLAHGCEHFEIGVERGDAHLEAHLVVALAGAAVRDVLGLMSVRLDDEVLDDDRPRHRREKRILVLVQRVGPERLGEELLDVLLAHVLDDGLDGPDRQRLLAHELEVLSLLANVDGKRDDVDVVVLLEPLDGHRGVQTARIREYYLVPSHESSFRVVPAGRACGRRELRCRHFDARAPRR